MASGDSPMLSPSRCSSDGLGQQPLTLLGARGRRAPASASPGSPDTASASESCSPSSASSTGSGGRRVAAAARRRSPGAATRPSTRCGVCVLTAGPYWAAGDDGCAHHGRRRRSWAISSGSTTRVGAPRPGGRAPNASAWLRAARPAAAPAAATPLREWSAHDPSDEPVARSRPATKSATTRTSTPMRPMSAA